MKKLLYIILILFVCVSVRADQKIWGDLEVEADLLVGDEATVTGTMTTSAGKICKTTKVTTTPYNILVTDEVLLVDTDAAAITVNLPAGVDGTHYKIVNVGTSGNDVIIDGNGAEAVLGSATQTLSDGEILDLHFETAEEWW